MFCPNCGKQIRDYDNFCRYCGIDLRVETRCVSSVNTSEDKLPIAVNEEYKLPEDDAEELVLYDVKKHWMSLFWPIVMTPVFFVYFWVIFLNTHSFFSWVIVLILLLPIVYPVLRYNSDKIVITTKYAHIKIGALNPEEIDIPLKNLDTIEVSQTVTGKILGYGMIAFIHKSQRYDYGYIKDPEDLQYIIDNPARFVHEAMIEDNTYLP